MSEHIKGIGTDIIEILRIKNAIRRHGKRFLQRIFTPQEQKYCLRYANPFPHFAGRFAAKEAIFKTLDSNVQKLMTWTDIEIEHNSKGQPFVQFSEKIQQAMHPQGKIELSISHCTSYAVAYAISISYS